MTRNNSFAAIQSYLQRLTDKEHGAIIVVDPRRTASRPTAPKGQYQQELKGWFEGRHGRYNTWGGVSLPAGHYTSVRDRLRNLKIDNRNLAALWCGFDECKITGMPCVIVADSTGVRWVWVIDLRRNAIVRVGPKVDTITVTQTVVSAQRTYFR